MDFCGIVVKPCTSCSHVANTVTMAPTILVENPAGIQFVYNHVQSVFVSEHFVHIFSLCLAANVYSL